jgi:hypothetical protein
MAPGGRETSTFVYGPKSTFHSGPARLSSMQQVQEAHGIGVVPRVTEPGHVRIFQCAECEKLDFKPEN